MEDTENTPTKEIKITEDIKEELKEVDIFRDTPVRYLGYANEIGETFRYVAPWFVLPSYFISLSYVFADAIDKARKECKNAGGIVTKKTVIEAFDCLTW